MRVSSVQCVSDTHRDNVMRHGMQTCGNNVQCNLSLRFCVATSVAGRGFLRLPEVSPIALHLERHAGLPQLWNIPAVDRAAGHHRHWARLLWID